MNKTDRSTHNKWLLSGRRFGLLLLSLLFVLSGCSSATEPATTQTSAPVALESTQSAQDVAEQPEATPTTEPSNAVATPTIDSEAASAELQELILSQLPATPTPASGDSSESFGGIAEVAIDPLKVPAGAEPLWLVYSLGFPNFEQEQMHFLSIYSYTDQTWKELAHHELLNATSMSTGSVEQVNLSSDRIWLFVQSGVGAHGGCLELMSYDLGKLKNEIESCNSSPLAGFVEDFDGDGFDEVIINDTENYVFCYACGERFFSYALHHWDGKQLQKIDLRTPPAVEVSSPLYQLYELAHFGLWKDYEQALAEADLGSDSLTKLYLALFDLHRKDFQEQAERGNYPLLDQLFYGDHVAAEAVLRAYAPEELFVSPSPVIAGTMADGWDEQVSTWITTTVDLLISANNAGDAPTLPEPIRNIDRLAAANYLYGWALSLSEEGPAAGRSYFERAASLKPEDTFYQATLSYVRSR
jgi:hypothetical protein